MTNIYIDIFTSEGKNVGHIDNCPSDAGSHVVKWEGVEVNSGIYYYRFTGVDADSKSHQYSDKIVKN